MSQCREAGIRDVEMLEDDGYTCVPQVAVQERLDEEVLDALDCVDRWELVGETAETYVYLLELTATGLPERTVDDYEDLIGTCDPSVTEQGILLSFVGSQEAIRNVLRNYEAAGASPDLRKLAEYDGGERALDALTERQPEVIETAFAMSFYEILRAASTDDVASELYLDPSTVAEHLQRAERNLLARLL